MAADGAGMCTFLLTVTLLLTVTAWMDEWLPMEQAPGLVEVLSRM